MLTIAVNAAIVVWVVLLLCAPGFILIRRWKLSGLVFVTVATFTLVVISAVTFATALLGYSTIAPLRVCAVILALMLVAAAVDLVRDWTGRGWRPARPTATGLAVPVSVFVGFWALLPPLIALRNEGQTFGLVTLGNNDLPNYVLFAENTAGAGFTNTHHVLNKDLGHVGLHESYVGATALINFATAATGLPAVDVVMAVMAVAIALLFGSLWCLSAAIWPRARFSAAAAAMVGVLAGLTVYTLGQFFLGSVLGLAGVCLALAGTVGVVRGLGVVALAELATGGASAVYCYGHLGLPLLVLLPIGAPALRFFADYANDPVPIRPQELRSSMHSAVVVRTAVRTAAAAVAAAGLAGLGLPSAVTLIAAQSTITAGIPLPPMTAMTAIGQPDLVGSHDGVALVSLSWAFVILVGAVALRLSWQGGRREPAVIGGACAAACVVVSVGAMAVYGPMRYQAWKMEAFLLPVALAAVLPALSDLRLRAINIGKPILLGLTVLVLTNPARAWRQILVEPLPGTVLPSTLTNLSDAPALKNVASINIQLPTFYETMSAGSVLSRAGVAFTANSYYVPVIAPGTCTLTTRRQIDPNEDPAKVTDLGDGYILLARPSPCAVRP